MKVLTAVGFVLFVSAIHLHLLQWLSGAFGVRSVTLAFLANWLIVSWVALVGQFVFFLFEVVKSWRNGKRLETAVTGLASAMSESTGFACARPTTWR
jgi:hypothetical protein